MVLRNDCVNVKIIVAVQLKLKWYSVKFQHVCLTWNENSLILKSHFWYQDAEASGWGDIWHISQIFASVNITVTVSLIVLFSIRDQKSDFSILAEMWFYERLKTGIV